MMWYSEELKDLVKLLDIPFNLAPIILAFLKRSCNKGLVEVTGNRVNRGAGYGLEIPCKYHFYGLPNTRP